MTLTPAKIAEITNLTSPSWLRRQMPYLLGEIASAIGDASALGKPAVGLIRIPTAVEDGETVTIGTHIYEFDTQDVAHVTAGHIRLDVHGGSAVKAQGTLTAATNPTSGDAFTIGTKVYTIVPIGTANGDGEVERGANIGATQLNIVAAINGTDDHNVASIVATASAFAANVCTLTALAGGANGNTIPTTETFTPAGDIFDGVVLGTLRPGVAPTGAEATTALHAAIEANDLTLTAVKATANEILLIGRAVGVNTAALAETMGGANNAVDSAAMRLGADAAAVHGIGIARVPTAVEVVGGNLYIPLSFIPTAVIAQVRVTSTGVLKAWDGAINITGGAHPFVAINNSGVVDWAETDTVTVLAFA